MSRIERLRAKWGSSRYDTQARLNFLRDEAKRGLPSNKVLHTMTIRGGEGIGSATEPSEIPDSPYYLNIVRAL